MNTTQIELWDERQNVILCTSIVTDDRIIFYDGIFYSLYMRLSDKRIYIKSTILEL